MTIPNKVIHLILKASPLIRTGLYFTCINVVSGSRQIAYFQHDFYKESSIINAPHVVPTPIALIYKAS